MNFNRKSEERVSLHVTKNKSKQIQDSVRLSSLQQFLKACYLRRTTEVLNVIKHRDILLNKDFIAVIVYFLCSLFKLLNNTLEI